MRIILTGAGGFLGSRLLAYYREKYEVWAPSHKELDFTDGRGTLDAVRSFRPDVLLHCGAISDVGTCEKNPELSMCVNVEGTRNLAYACAAVGARMVFSSSDQVYFRRMEEGESQEKFLRPHREKEACRPVPVYGQHKLQAEAACLEAQPDSVILRLTWMYGKLTEEERRKGRRNLAFNLEELCRMLHQRQVKKKQSYSVTDHRGVTDVEEVVRRMEAAWELPAGIYNFGSPASGSMYEIMRGVLENTGMKELLEPVSGGGGIRNLCMDPEKTAGTGIVFPETSEGLRHCLEDILSVSG